MKENNRGKDNHKLTLSIDRVLVEMAKQCLDVSISQFLEDQLRAYFRMDDEQTILDEIQTRENEINAFVPEEYWYIAADFGRHPFADTPHTERNDK